MHRSPPPFVCAREPGNKATLVAAMFRNDIISKLIASSLSVPPLASCYYHIVIVGQNFRRLNSKEINHNPSLVTLTPLF